MILLLVLIILTNPRGEDVYVNPEMVVTITKASGGTQDCNTDVSLASGHICVSEDPVDVKRKLSGK